MAEVRSGKDGIDLLKSRIGQPLQPNRFVVEFTKLPELLCQDLEMKT